jgi:hypothetical protein
MTTEVNPMTSADIGQEQTTLSQIVAEELGVRLEDVRERRHPAHAL